MNRFILVAAWLLLLTASAAPAQSLKIATLAPDGSSWMKAFQDAANDVEQATEGRVRIRYYPGGVMGDADAVLRRIRLGQLHGGAFTLGELGKLSLSTYLYSLPFLFTDEQEVLAMRQHFDAVIVKALDEEGMVVPGWAMGGFAYLFAHRPVPAPQSLDTNWRIWVPPDDPLSINILKQAGASPVPLTLAEVYTALQTGTINTFGSTPSAAIILQWHTRARYVLDLPLLMTGGTIGFDRPTLKRMSAADRELLLDRFAAALRTLEEGNRNENQQARLALIDQGIEFQAPTPEQISSWRELARQTLADMRAEGAIQVPNLDELTAKLDAWRDADQ